MRIYLSRELAKKISNAGGLLICISMLALIFAALAAGERLDLTVKYGAIGLVIGSIGKCLFEIKGGVYGRRNYYRG